MVNKCCIPRCTSNYASKLPVEGHVSSFAFPRDPQMRELWLKSIPRDDLVITKQTVVCKKHFIPSDIIREDVIPGKNGEPDVVVQRKKPALRKTAIPCIFSIPPSKPRVPKVASFRASSANQQKAEMKDGKKGNPSQASTESKKKTPRERKPRQKSEKLKTLSKESKTPPALTPQIPEIIVKQEQPSVDEVFAYATSFTDDLTLPNESTQEDTPSFARNNTFLSEWLREYAFDEKSKKRKKDLDCDERVCFSHPRVSRMRCSN